MGIEALVKAIVSRVLPTPDTDNDSGSLRLGRYHDLYVKQVVRKQHGLADEGSYFICNNAQSGLATAAGPVTFSSVNPFIVIYNADSVSNQNYKRIHLDYAALTATAIGTAGASLQCAVVIDSGNRYVSSGTNLTSSIANPNGDLPVRSSVANVYGGNITASTATGAARTVVGNRYLKGAIPVVGDEYYINFGGVEAVASLTISTIIKTAEPMPPIIIGPGQSALIFLWLPSQSAASSYAPEIGWWER